MKAQFGNVEQINMVKKEQAEQEWKDTSEECAMCHGTGWVEHDCLCDLCEVDEQECGDCRGKGRIEKTAPDEAV